MTTPEGRLSQKILKTLNSLPHTFAFKVHGSEFMTAGLPDILCCSYGMFIGLEVKLPETRSRVSKRQQRVHDQIKHAGGAAQVVCSVDEALAVIRDVFLKRP